MIEAVVPTFEFDRATALSGTAPDFTVTLDGRWDGGRGTNGGFLLTLAARAIGAVLPFPDPVVVSGFYLRPGTPGPAAIQTEVIRSGKTTAFGQASLHQNGKEVLRATAAFSDLAAAAMPGGPSYTGTAPPALPPPERCAVLKPAQVRGATLAERIEYRADGLPYWVTPGAAPSGNPVYEGWMRLADGREPDLYALLLFLDAAAPPALELGTESSTLELTVHLRARPAPGWLAYRAVTHHLGDGYHEEDAEVWDSAGRMVAQSRQLAVIRH
jgi:acyl-CoA thioesterase